MGNTNCTKNLNVLKLLLATAVLSLSLTASGTLDDGNNDPDGLKSKVKVKSKSVKTKRDSAATSPLGHSIPAPNKDDNSTIKSADVSLFDRWKADAEVSDKL